MEKAMAPHSNTLAWKISWTEEPGGLQSMGSWRVGHDWATSFHFSFPCIGEGNGNPLQCSYLENPRDGRAWWSAVYGVAQNRTCLKQLSSSSSSIFQRQLVSFENFTHEVKHIWWASICYSYYQWYSLCILFVSGNFVQLAPDPLDFILPWNLK